MHNPRVASRYAKALVQTALETNQLDEIKKDIEFLRANGSPELNAVIASPVIRGERKLKIFKAIYGGKVSQLTESFFSLVFTKGREFVLPDIVAAFHEQYNEIKGIVNATITTTVTMDEKLYEDLYRRITGLPRFRDKTVNLEAKIDEKIIGGFIFQAGDNKFDASVRHDLQFIRQEFIQNLYEMKY